MCVLLKQILLPFVSFSYSLSCTLQWKAVRVIGKIRVVYKLIKMSCYSLSDMSIRCVCVCVRGCVCVNGAGFFFSLSSFNVFYEDWRSQNAGIDLPAVFTFSPLICHFTQCVNL